jgi:hypothetical protein
MNKGICKDIYSGMYRIWVSLYFSCFFFLVLSIVSSILYQYFGLIDRDQTSGESAHASFGHSREYELPEAIPAAAVVFHEDEEERPKATRQGNEKAIFSEGQDAYSIRY